MMNEINQEFPPLMNEGSFLPVSRLDNSHRYQMRAGMQIPSLHNLIEELIVNSLDAKCSNIELLIKSCDGDLSLEICDDGAGISLDNLLNLFSNRYCTSKSFGEKKYGFKGEAISSIKEIADVMILSRAKESNLTYLKNLRTGSVVSVEGYYKYGTTVFLSNIFACFPVRRLNLKLPHEIIRIKEFIEKMSIIHYRVGWSFIDMISKKVICRFPTQNSVGSRFISIHPQEILCKMKEVSVSYDHLKIEGLISSLCKSCCHWTKDYQFLYVNKRWMRTSNILSEIINKAFYEFLSAGKSMSGPPPKHHRPSAHRSTLYPCFILQLSCSTDEYDVLFEADKSVAIFKNIEKVRSCLDEIFTQLKNDKLSSKEDPQWEASSDGIVHSPISTNYPLAINDNSMTSPIEINFNFDNNVEQNLYSLEIADKYTMSNSKLSERLIYTREQQLSPCSQKFQSAFGFMCENNLQPPVHVDHTPPRASSNRKRGRIDCTPSNLFVRDIFECDDEDVDDDDIYTDEHIDDTMRSVAVRRRNDTEVYFDNLFASEDCERNVYEEGFLPQFEYSSPNVQRAIMNPHVIAINGDSCGSSGGNPNPDAMLCVNAEESMSPLLLPCNLLLASAQKVKDTDCIDRIDDSIYISTTYSNTNIEINNISSILPMTSPIRRQFSLEPEMSPIEEPPVTPPASVLENETSKTDDNNNKEQSVRTDTIKPFTRVDNLFSAASTTKSIRRLSDFSYNNSTTVTREMLHDSRTQVLNQVDNKFIMVKEKSGLVLAVDQHAADERIKFEEFLAVYKDTKNLGVQIVNIEISLSKDESSLLEERRECFTKWKFGYDIKNMSDQVLLFQVPIIHNEALNEHDFREYIQFVKSNIDFPINLLTPPAFHRILASLSCRSAVKFGDVLTHIDCKNILAKLSHCEMPFQCAHGRPTIVPIVKCDFKPEIMGKFKAGVRQSINKQLCGRVNFANLSKYLNR